VKEFFSSPDIGALAGNRGWQAQRKINRKDQFLQLKLRQATFSGQLASEDRKLVTGLGQLFF
jgi:hypothetical protein